MVQRRRAGAAAREVFDYLQAVKIGESAIRKSLHEQLGYLRDDVSALGSGDYPRSLARSGRPFDMDSKRSYGWTDGGKHKGDYSAQEKALDASIAACDAWTDGTGAAVAELDNMDVRTR